MKTAPTRNPIAVTENEQQALAQLDALLEHAAPASLHFVGQEGNGALLPEPARDLLHQLVHQLARGNAVTIVPAERLLTTQEAADLLDISRPFLVRLLDRGDIPFIKVGTHRRIRCDELLTYKQRRDAQRRTALRDLTQMSQELGLYGAAVSTETR